MSGLGLQRVLCALDVEGSSSGALSVASLIAEKFRASVDGLYAPAPVASATGREERVRRLIAEHNARERLHGLLAPMSSLLDVTSYVTRGRPSDVILAHSELHCSDLIVLGASAPARFGDGGGTVTPVSTGASCAVLSVPPALQQREVRRILLPVGEAFADAPATSWAISLATRFGAEVDVVPVRPADCGFWRVLSSSASRTKSAWASADERVRSSSRATLSKLRAARICAREIAHLEHSSLDAIPALAEGGAFDLIIMGLHPRSDAGSPDDVIGSLRRRAEVPVLSVREAAVHSSFAYGGHRANQADGFRAYGASA